MVKRRSQSGQALTEFALCSTVFFILLFGILEVGRAVYTWVVLDDAARVAATQGALIPPSNQGEMKKVLENAANEVLSVHFDEETVRQYKPYAVYPNFPGDPLQVTIQTSNYTSMIGQLIPALAGNISMQATRSSYTSNLGNPTITIPASDHEDKDKPKNPYAGDPGKGQNKNKEPTVNPPVTPE